MSFDRPPKTIGIFGHVGNQNLGDEAIIAAVIQNIRCRYPDANIKGFTINPEDTRARHKIPSFPIRRLTGTSRPWNSPGSQPKGFRTFQRIKRRLKWSPRLYAIVKGIYQALPLPWMWLEELKFLSTCYKNLKGTDLLIIAGSHQLNDYRGGSWAFPYTIFKWSLLARLSKTKVAFLSVGAGPITARLSKTFVKWSLSRACYRSYRDERSREVILECGVAGKNVVAPDLVYSLRLPNRLPASRPASPLPIVGINPLPFFDESYWHNSDPSVYEAYVQTLAHFANWLVQRGHTVLFFPTQLLVDPRVIRDIRHTMKSNGAATREWQLIESQIRSFDDLVSQISSVDIVIATRYHGILLSFLLHKPVLGLAYHGKSRDLMALMGQAEYALDAVSCNLDSLKERFISLESRRGEIVQAISRRLPSVQQAVAIQYDHVFRLLEEPRAAAS